MQSAALSGSAAVRALRSTDLWEQEAGLRAVINFAYEERNRPTCGSLTQPVVALLLAKNRVINMFAAWALANICLNSPLNRKKIRDEPGAFAAIVRNLSSATNELTLQKHLHLVINLTIDDPANRAGLTREGVLPVLLGLLQQDYRSVVLSACDALVNLLYDEQAQQQLVATGGLDKLLQLYDSPTPEPELQSVISSILIMLTAFDSNIRTALLKSDILAPLNRSLMSPNLEVQKRSVLLLYNLLLDDTNEQSALDAGTILPLTHLLSKSSPRDLLKEICALLAPFSQNEEFRREFRLSGGVPRVAAVLQTLSTMPPSDPVVSAAEDLLTVLVNLTVDDKSRKQLLDADASVSLESLRQSGLTADHEGLIAQALTNLRIPVRAELLQETDVMRKAPAQLPVTPRGGAHDQQPSPFEDDEVTRFTLQATPSDQLSLLPVEQEQIKPVTPVSETICDTAASIASLIERIEAYALPKEDSHVFDFPAMPALPPSRRASTAGPLEERHEDGRTSQTGASQPNEPAASLPEVHVVAPRDTAPPRAASPPQRQPSPKPVGDGPARHVSPSVTAAAVVVPAAVRPSSPILSGAPTVPAAPVEHTVSSSTVVPHGTSSSSGTLPAPADRVGGQPTRPTTPPSGKHRTDFDDDGVSSAFSQASATQSPLQVRSHTESLSSEAPSSPSGSQIKRDKEKHRSSKRSSRLVPEDASQAVTSMLDRTSSTGEGSRIQKEKHKEGSRIHKEKKEKKEKDSGSRIKSSESGSQIKDKDKSPSGSRVHKEKSRSRRESVAGVAVSVLPAPVPTNTVPPLRETSTSVALALPKPPEDPKRPSTAGRVMQDQSGGKERSPAYVDARNRAAAAKVKRLPPEEEEKINNRRFMIATEILTTERFYVSSLSLVIRLYLEPLKQDANTSKKPMLPPEDVPVIFSGWEIIHRLNTEFLKRLEERMKNWRYNLPLGDLFQALAPTIRLYSSFITAYDKAVSKLEMHCSHNKRLRQYLYDTHRLPECRSLDLAGFLIMPIQRVPRYNLLLSDLVKSTPEYYDDFAPLSLALERMKEVASYLNEVKRRAEDVRKTISIQESLLAYQGEPLASLRRAFVKEGTVLHHTPKGPKYVFMFLFTDLLLVAKQIKSRQYKYNRTLPLEPLKIELVPANDDNKFAFRILNGVEELLMYTTTEGERRAWLEAFPAALKQHKSMHA